MTTPLPNPADLFNQGVVLRQQGKLEEAGDAFRQAAAVFRLLAQANLGVFDVDIARCLGAYSDVTAQRGLTTEAWKASFDALTELLPAFERDPQGQDELMREVAGGYIGFCDRLGVKPDVGVMKRIEVVLARM